MFFKKGGKKTLGKRLFSLPALLIYVFTAVSLSCLFFISNLPMNYAQVKLLTNQDALAKSEVYTAISLLEVLNQKVKSGELTMIRAKKLGADLLRDMSYGANNEGYFFVDTTAGVNVVLYGDKATEGRNRLEDNVNGIYYIKEILKAGQQADGGYTDYWYPKKGETMVKKKRSYSLEFKPFDWVVGTGYYLEDIK